MYLGLDLGTSSLKALIIDSDSQVVASASRTLFISRPKPLYSEQNPQDWVRALEGAMQDLSSTHPSILKQVQAIGLTGQMHGAVCLDTKGGVLRPAILWNDGRSYLECQDLTERCPLHARITGNLMMPGFTLPKLIWMAKNEPDIFAKIDQVLLPKDYLRFILSGDFATDLSDASGTGWVDVAQRTYSDELLDASGMKEQQMPALFEGTAQTGRLKQEWAKYSKK